MKISEWIQFARHELEKAGIESSLLEAQLLAAHVMEKSRAWALAHSNNSINAEKCLPILARRLKKEPLPYILGYKEFYGRNFTVNNSVLIPRNDTETLIDAVLKGSSKEESLDVLDIGTGSGCIAITLALECKNWHISASDISIEALKLAIGNAEILNAKVDFYESNLFQNLPEKKWNIIVSNPPYIDKNDPEVETTVHNFEPHQALYADNNGLYFYQQLAHKSKNYLTSNGSIYLEIGYQQKSEIMKVFVSQGWLYRETIKDLSGRDRVMVFEVL